ncbi:hypothetical protein F442_20970 [Phytophthora nicotianae P10297]|uniref:Uncharacterized protein n=1 Tax=Phytophthora nicotianae P10297 TaxID=1317064 RepID=W2Y5E9_PHYNI|nr:hypothetical protein F442_20970 [Phytophthora nicotianae P10297]
MHRDGMEEGQREGGHVGSAQVSPWNATRRGSTRPLESTCASRACVRLGRGVLNAGVMLTSPWSASLPCPKALSRKVFRIVIKGGLARKCHLSHNCPLSFQAEHQRGSGSTGC